MRVLFVAAALLVLAPGGSAQERVRFECSEHLEGYETADLSEWRGLYPLEEFAVYDGQELLRAELEEIQARWKDERARVVAEIDALQADPEKLYDHRLRGRLAKHPFFSEVACQTVPKPPFVFLVQEGPAEDPGRATRLVRRTLELLEPTVHAFETRFAQPAGLGPRSPHVRFLVVILASSDDFERYVVSARTARHSAGRALYDHDLLALVVPQQDARAAEWTGEFVRAARHAFTHVLEQVWYSGASLLPAGAWCFEGLADHLARFSDAAAGAPLRPDPALLREAIAVASDPGLCPTHWRTLAELVSVDEPSDLGHLLRERLRDPALVPEGEDLDAIWHSFQRQSALFLFFLAEAGAGRHRPGLDNFLRQAFRGEGDASVFTGALAGFPLDELEREFGTWLLAEFHAAWPDVALDEAAFWGAGAAPVVEAPEPDVPLDLEDATGEERFALALARVRAGQARAGLSAIEALLAEPQADELAARLGRERARVTAWLAARDTFLAHLAQKAKTLEFQLDGRDLKAGVAGLEQDVVLLQPNRSGLTRLEVEALDPLVLARQMPRSLDPATPEWVRIYPYVLGGDGRWKQLLKEDGGDGEALRSDARDDYPARLRLGDGLARLSTIASAAAPSSTDEVRDRLLEIQALREEFGDLAFVERKRPALRQRARELLRAELELAGPWTALRGKFEAQDGDVVRITYEFDDPRELEDFESTQYAERVTKGYPPLPAEGPGPGFRVETGMLRATGKATLRTWIDLAAPLSVRYTLEVSVPPGKEKATHFLAVGACDDRKEHFVWGINHDDLQRVDLHDTESAGEEGARYFYDTTYSMELRHDGERVELLLEGQPGPSLPSGSRREGAIFLWVHSALEVRVRRLEIEGHAPAFERLTERWVERELARFWP